MIIHGDHRWDLLVLHLPWEIAAIFKKIAAWAKPHRFVTASFYGGGIILPKGQRVYFMRLTRHSLRRSMEFEIGGNLLGMQVIYQGRRPQIVLDLCDPNSLDELKRLVKYYK